MNTVIMNTKPVTLGVMEVVRLEQLLLDAACVSFGSSSLEAFTVRRRINLFLENLRKQAS